MSIIKEIAVLNTVTALGADLDVNANGNTFITNLGFGIPTRSIIDITSQDPVTAVAGVVTVTPTAANSAIYSIVINGWDTTSGAQRAVKLVYTTSSSGDTATTICDAWRTALATQTGFSVVGTGTATLIITGATTVANGGTPYVTFSVGSTASSVSSASASGSAVTIGANISATRTTASVDGFGTTAALQQLYPPNSNASGTNYAQISNLTSASTYTQWLITYTTPDVSFDSANTTNLCQVVVLVKSGVTNFATLSSSWGTLGQLALGYKATLVAAGANIDFGSNNATRASGSFVTELLKSDDQIAISDGVTLTTNGLATVLAPYSTGAAAGVAKAVIDNANTVTAGAAFVIQRTNLPL